MPHSICTTVEEFKEAIKLSRNWKQLFNTCIEEEEGMCDNLIGVHLKHEFLYDNRHIIEQLGKHRRYYDKGVDDFFSRK